MRAARLFDRRNLEACEVEPHAALCGQISRETHITNAGQVEILQLKHWAQSESHPQGIGDTSRLLKAKKQKSVR
jgi:hypothetical protein